MRGDGPHLPIAVTLGPIGVTFEWWRDSALRLEAAGYAGVRCWDHFITRGGPPRSVLEAWTTLSSVAAVTSTLTVGTFVANVMNRHPALLARMAATLQQASGGRLVLGLGIGGRGREHEMYGMAYPPPAERAERLEEAVAVMRALWTGGPVTFTGRHYRLAEAVALPVPEPLPPIIIGAQTPAGVRLAARVADGWTCEPGQLDAFLPRFLDALGAAGRSRADVTITVGFEGGRTGVDALAGSPWIESPRATFEAWRARGADDIVLTARTTADVDALVRAAERW